MFMVYITVVNRFYKPIYNWVGITFFPPWGCSSIYMWIHFTMAYHIIAQSRRMEYHQLDEWIINHLFPTWASHAGGAQFGTRIQRWLGKCERWWCVPAFVDMWKSVCMCVLSPGDRRQQARAGRSKAARQAAPQQKLRSQKSKRKKRRWETQRLQVGIPMGLLRMLHLRKWRASFTDSFMNREVSQNLAISME